MLMVPVVAAPLTPTSRVNDTPGMSASTSKVPSLLSVMVTLSGVTAASASTMTAAVVAESVSAPMPMDSPLMVAT